MKKIFICLPAILTVFCSLSQESAEHFLLIGTYTSGKSAGIYTYKFNSQTGSSQPADSIKSSNPSFLSISPDQKFVYAVNEDAPGNISAFSFDKKNGSLTFLNRQPSCGNHPCYITVDKTGKWVITGNYSSGTLAVYPVKKDGSLDNAVDSILHEGSSVDPRQQSAHVHAAVLNKSNKLLYVPDLGMDKLMLYRFNDKTGKLTEARTPFVITEPGAGPRHFEIHPNGKFAYLVEEFSGSVSAYALLKDGTPNLFQNISALPRDYMGQPASADIHVSPDGNFLYVSNRGGTHTLGIFKINTSNGWLEWIGYQSVLGKRPRNFNFDPSGDFLLVANQDSDEIVIFKRDKQTGLLTDSGKRIHVPNPVCIKWIPVK